MPIKTQRRRTTNVVPFPPRYPEEEARLAAAYLSFHQCPSEWARALELMTVVNDFLLDNGAINSGAAIDRAFSTTRAIILALDLVPESELLPPLRGRSPKEIFAAVVDYVWDPYRQDEVL